MLAFVVGAVPRWVCLIQVVQMTVGLVLFSNFHHDNNDTGSNGSETVPPSPLSRPSPGAGLAAERARGRADDISAISAMEGRAWPSASQSSQSSRWSQSSSAVAFSDDHDHDLVVTLNALKVVELRDELRARGRSSQGVKAELVQRMAEAIIAERGETATATAAGVGVRAEAAGAGEAAVPVGARVVRELDGALYYGVVVGSGPEEQVSSRRGDTLWDVRYENEDGE